MKTSDERKTRPDRRGERCGTWELGERIATTFAGARYLAVGRRGALAEVEILDTELVEGDSALAATFRRAMWATSRVRHPGVMVPEEDGISADGTAWVARTRAAATLGESLHDLVPHHPDPEQFLTEVGDLLGAAHRVGVVHGDLRPEHIFLGGTNTDHGSSAVVIGFLGAEVLARVPPEHRPLDHFLYCAPEVARGDADIDERADVFAFAAILATLLEGAPVRAQGAFHVDRSRAVAAANTPFPCRSTWPEPLSRALAFDRSERFPNLQALLAALSPENSQQRPLSSPPAANPGSPTVGGRPPSMPPSNEAPRKAAEGYLGDAELREAFSKYGAVPPDATSLEHAPANDFQGFATEDLPSITPSAPPSRELTPPLDPVPRPHVPSLLPPGTVRPVVPSTPPPAVALRSTLAYAAAPGRPSSSGGVAAHPAPTPSGERKPTPTAGTAPQRTISRSSLPRIAALPTALEPPVRQPSNAPWIVTGILLLLGAVGAFLILRNH